LERPSKAIRREKSEEAKIQLNLNQQKLVDTELRNAQLRRENLLMEKQILELKLLYWKEKNRL
uniref:Transposase n=1 Tax=Heligmosomoides polygyrus TaxID=6339 RepID=A0A183G2X5_HELPZ